MNTPRLGLVLLSSIIVGACEGEAPSPDACAWSEGPHARVLSGGDWVPEGPDALATPGDALLANGRAAFVIQDPATPRTYYHYGGTPIDAVAMEGCEQASPEQFGELGFAPGQLDLLEITDSVMRQFRGDAMEVVSDGSDGGAAHVRVTGVDDRFWLVDYTLTGQAADAGRRRPLSTPLGVAWAVDYRLAPDTAVLDITITATNTTSELIPLLVGALLFPSARTRQTAWAADDLAFGGFQLRAGVPWLSLGSDEAGYALAFDEGNAAYANVSGANAMLDLGQVLDGTFDLAPAGEEGDQRAMRMWLAAGDGEAHSAIDRLTEVGVGVPSPRKVSGRVEGVSEPAMVRVEAARRDGVFAEIDRVRTDASGAFEARLPGSLDLRVSALAGEADPTPPQALGAGEITGLSLTPGPTGVIRIAATDGDGPIPVRATLLREEGPERVLFVPPEGLSTSLPVGAWEIALTRGYEHLPWEGPVRVTVDDEVAVEAELPRVVDTRGWISVDGHVHTGPSPDSDIPAFRRFATAATFGLDVMVQTDHEVIADLSETLAASPWSGHLHSVLGQEVTASLPEHVNMWGVVIEPEHGPRGGPVAWYGLGLEGIYKAIRARGAAVVQLNHPGWMTRMGYDVLTGQISETDPTRWGLPADAGLWSWDLDAIELQNGGKYIFGEAEDPGRTGMFRAWSSFFNLGRRVTGVAVTDVHGRDTPGSFATWIQVPDDSWSGFDEDTMLAALVEGRAIMSSGAFLELTATAGTETEGIGGTLTVEAGDPTVGIRVQALPGIRVDRTVLFVNCDAVQELVSTGPDDVLKLDAEVTLDLDADAWITAVAFGSGAYPRGLDTVDADVARAIANPVFVDVDGNGRFDSPGGRSCDFAGLTP